MGAIMLVSAKSINADRGNIDDKARKIVLDAYREGCRTRSHAPFDTALNNYCSQYPHISPDSPDEMASGQLRTPISVVVSSLYAGSGSRVLTDATGERRNCQ